MLTSAKLDATGQHWVSHLANYKFDIEYRSGKSNIDADALSRIKWSEKMPQQVSYQAVAAVLDSTKLEDAPVEALFISQQVVPDLDSTWLRDLVGVDWSTVQ